MGEDLGKESHPQRSYVPSPINSMDQCSVFSTPIGTTKRSFRTLKETSISFNFVL